MNELVLRALRLLLEAQYRGQFLEQDEIGRLLAEIDQALAAWAELAEWEAEPPPPTTILAGSKRDIEAALADK
jgi:hypothetical protein